MKWILEKEERGKRWLRDLEEERKKWMVRKGRSSRRGNGRGRVGERYIIIREHFDIDIQ